MKTFILALLLAVYVGHADAAKLGAPFSPEVDARFNSLEGPAKTNPNYPRADSGSSKHTAQATYDSVAIGSSPSTFPLGISIPANAIITRSYIYSHIKPTTSQSATLAFKCQNTSDILAALAAASFASAGASIDGVSTGSASTFKYTTAACNIQAVVATGALTAGKVTAYVEYTLHK